VHFDRTILRRLFLLVLAEMDNNTRIAYSYIRRLKMFDYQLTRNSNERLQGALEISLQARAREREMALLAGEYRNTVKSGASKTTHFLQVLFASLFLG
jgi:hypothetical protein